MRVSESETDRQTDRQRKRERKKETDREREKERDRQRERDKETKRQETERETGRERVRHTHTHTHTNKERERVSPRAFGTCAEKNAVSANSRTVLLDSFPLVAAVRRLVRGERFRDQSVVGPHRAQHASFWG